MRALGTLLVLAALAALALFLWPVIRPEVAQGPRPETYSRERSLGVAAAAPSAAPSAAEPAEAAPAPGAAAPQQPQPAAPPADPAGAGPDRTAGGPLCDRLVAAADARKLAPPRGTWLRRATTPCAGAWTWVNVWAAWCKPCKEEMPLLVRWAQALNRDGCRVRLLFLSVDDDERELRRHLDGPARTLDADFLWLESEAERAALYRALGLPAEPTLPLQAVLDPAAALRCVRVGSIGERELAAAQTAFGW